MRDIIVRVGEMSWIETDATHFHAELGLLDKGRAIQDFRETPE